jgi:DNA-directed RNA polymerase II subunit RPB2
MTSHKTDLDNATLWKIINSHFDENPQSLVAHHLESFNDFYQQGIQQIFREKNPLRLSTKFDKKIDDYRYQCNMYFGGKDGSKIYFGKPVIYDDNNAHYMFPNEARMRNMTYGMTIHYDIDVEFIRILEPGEQPTLIGTDALTAPEIVSGGGLGVDQIDYSYENKAYAEQQRAGKFKNNKMTHEEMEEYLKEYADDEEESDKTTTPGRGGAPRKDGIKTKPRKPAKQAVLAEVTPAIAALLREQNEKSFVAPNTQSYTITLPKIYLGKFPIMVQSNFCILDGLSREVRYSMGECRNDLGGYFIIDGKEKTVIPQEKFADNMLYIRKVDDGESLYSAEIRSVSENVSKPIRTFSVKMVAPSTRYSNKNLVVNIPNVRKPIPLFVVFRALGIVSDKDIITMCLLDLEKYETMVDLFIPSVHDAGGILSQQTALEFIATFTKLGTVTYVLEILADYFLPHVGEVAYIQKAYYLGYIVFRLLCVSSGLEQPTDRDNFKYKRVELVGSLIYDLFREYYTLQQRSIHLEFEKKIYYGKGTYENDLHGLVMKNHQEILKERIVEDGFRKAFKGNWGAQAHTKRIGVIQDLNRLSFNSALSHLRKTNLPMDAGVKLVGPRVLHTSHWGFIDPLDTPDGGNIGLHKQLAITTYVSRGLSREPVIQWLREKASLRMVEDCGPQSLAEMTKVIVNGYWCGAVSEPVDTVKKIRLYRRNALLPIHMSATFDIKQNTIFIYSDAGRLSRPIFYKDEHTGKMSYENPAIVNKLVDGDFTWTQLVSGFSDKKAGFHPNVPKIRELPELYEGVGAETNPTKLERFLSEKAVIDYIDPSESEDALIAVNMDEVAVEKHTHVEIHESLIFGMMCNLIIFPENNPPVRNSFSCGQSKQAVSMYHTNHQVRMDKTAVVLNSGQIPLVKSRFTEIINHEENPYGENAIVAIMCYTGYNVEDAILINEGALKRGLFRTTYYTTYEAHEENSKQGDVVVNKKFTNIESLENVVGTKSGYDYSKLDSYGIIRENTEVNDRTILIGLTSNCTEYAKTDIRIDDSKKPKKGQLGIVDKTFITEGEEGERIAKIRLREERIPNLGDKMASRSGQKGTIGMVIPECDMPFTKDGIRPDLIINPHAIPTRMTIGQLVECITGKACSVYGAFGDCTAFNNKGSKIGVYGELLSNAGFHSSGNEILYNGMTGEQIETEIFMGPTYYMRLKHMVKDKINYRATGPRTALTRQPVSGRANDGGLRIGEMERDVVISHGATNFLKESMMDRGDKYHMAICNQTGMIAIYNPSKNLFMSPMADGPIQYTGSIDGKTMNIENITRFGRSFSVINIPYSLKLLIQELQTINLQMRIITEDNIAQIENMSYSKNIEKLMMKPGATMTDVINETKSKFYAQKTALGSPASVHEPDALDDAAKRQLAVLYGESPPYDSPDYDPNVSPPYATGSPAYDPNYDPSSPAYAPGSPAYDPNYDPSSPAYATGSPTYHPNYGDNSPQYPDVSPAYSPEYNQNSPPYAPTSPEFPPPGTSPPMAPNNVGGGMARDFQVGDIVYLRGGKKSASPFNVIKKGDKFLTVESMDPTNQDDDSIQVVMPFELLKPEEIHEANMFERPMIRQGTGQGQGQGTGQNQSQSQGQGPEGQGIVFAPVIRIVNGNDNSTNDGSNDAVRDPTNNSMAQKDPFSVPVIKQSSDNARVIKNVAEESAAPVAAESQSGGGWLDFAKNLIIKKTG